MLVSLKKFFFVFTFNFSLFLLLIIGIQNSSNQSKVNLLISETVKLPISFIIGLSFISGSITANLITIDLQSKKS